MWKGKRFGGDTIHFFALLCLLFIPVANALLPLQADWADRVFGPLIRWLIHSTHTLHPPPARVSSDSTAMYWLVALLLILALGIRVLLIFLNWHAWRRRVLPVIRLLAVYYLAYRLLEYGADKVFKGQFYQPEPNTLYTAFGQLDRDLLYWSTMGLSYSYNLFLGIGELVAALLLLIRRTRTLGLLLSLFILANIVAINFGFDISVKLYSLFLSLLALLGLAPAAGRLYRFFLRRDTVQLPREAPPFSRAVTTGLRIFAWGFLLINVGLPYLQSGKWNDDRAERPRFHGAYEVVHTFLDGDTLQAAHPFRRFFIHRKGYLILQAPDDRMQDYRLAMDTVHQVFILTNYEQEQTEIRYREIDTLLELHFVSAQEPFRLLARKLRWERLPALQPSFHWTVDGHRP